MDPWECDQSSDVDFSAVLSRMIKDLRNIYCGELKPMKRDQLMVYHCCGSDHAQKCKLLDGRLHDDGVRTLVVRRPSMKLDTIEMKSDLEKGVLIVEVPPVDYDRSSTKARQLLIDGKWEELTRYLHPAVIEHMKSLTVTHSSTSQHSTNRKVNQQQSSKKKTTKKKTAKKRTAKKKTPKKKTPKKKTPKKKTPKKRTPKKGKEKKVAAKNKAVDKKKTAAKKKTKGKGKAKAKAKRKGK